ncbi:MAG TPA: MFS transporter [Candidatus Wallbacteria bacterium]|nr:MFS transporter [Candidatus Wallbacteria bacterium]
MSIADKIRNHPLYLFPNFRNFFIGDVLVAIAERFFAITFVWWIVSQEGENGKWVGVLMSLEAVPIFFLSPFVGPLIDRYDKKKCMIMGALMQMLFVSIIAALFYKNMLSFPMLCALSFLMSCFVPQFEDSVSASIALVVDKKHLSSATATQSSSIDFSNIVAASGSAYSVLQFGMLNTILINIALYFVGALFLMSIKLNLSHAHEENDEDGGEEESYFAELKSGFKYIRSNVPLMAFSLLYTAGTIFIMSIFVLIPLIVKDVLHEDIAWVAIFETSISVGVVITALLFSFKTSYKNFYAMISANYIIYAMLMGALAFSMNKVFISAIIFCVGCVFAADLALSFVFFQNVVKNEFKGRFFGMMSSITAGITPLSYMMAGVITDYFTLKYAALLNAAGGLIICFAMLSIPRVPDEIGAVDEDDEDSDCEGSDADEKEVLF